MDLSQRDRKMMRISEKYKFEYVCCLPRNLEATIMKRVEKVIHSLLLSEEERAQALEDANTSKVCDLTETIDICFC